LNTIGAIFKRYLFFIKEQIVSLLWSVKYSIMFAVIMVKWGYVKRGRAYDRENAQDIRKAGIEKRYKLRRQGR
jgi:hypothetical protein